MATSSSSPSRMAYLDNLRSFVVLLVVVMHSNVTYSGMGSWYYTEARFEDLGPISKLLFGLYGCFTQAWFMGVLFFISGALAARALARRGSLAFARERLYRLGSPLLLFMLVVHPLTVYYFYDHGRFLHSISLAQFYLGFVREGHVLSATGPLWFAQVLLLFSLAYAAMRAWFQAPPASGTPPRNKTLLMLSLLTGALAFLIRLSWPIGTAFMNLQFCFFASYLVLFALGVRAGEQNWLETLPENLTRRWLAVGLAGIPLWFALILSTGILKGRAPLIEGGLHWQAAAYAFWEGFVAIAMSIGLLGFFRLRFNQTNRLSRLLSTHCFRIYVFHTPVLVAISIGLAGWHVPMLLKHAIVAPLACLATLALSEGILRRIPGLENITR